MKYRFMTNQEQASIARDEMKRCLLHIIGYSEFLREKIDNKEAANFVCKSLENVAQSISDEFQLLYGSGDQEPLGLLNLEPIRDRNA